LRCIFTKFTVSYYYATVTNVMTTITAETDEKPTCTVPLPETPPYAANLNAKKNKRGITFKLFNDLHKMDLRSVLPIKAGFGIEWCNAFANYTSTGSTEWSGMIGVGVVE
jgi:hypothetical protein